MSLFPPMARNSCPASIFDAIPPACAFVLFKRMAQDYHRAASQPSGDTLMSLSMYQASVPVLIHNLKTLSAILKKAAAHAKARGIDPAVLVNARLFPDMFPLSRQVQIASDMAKGAGARLASIENPSFADTETTFAELQTRLARTIAFLKSIRPEQLEGSEERAVTLQMRMGSMAFSGQSYLLGWVMPNVYFHMTTAYNILRHNGVELGKQDFIGQAPGVMISAGKRKAAPRTTAAARKSAASKR
jgi:hypothetical protein